jgi:hypothetical protein
MALEPAVGQRRQCGITSGPIRAARAILVGAKAVIRPKPVEPSTRFYLSINRGTAGKLGLPIPLGLLAQADDVIE